jgi:hypothetical protein
LLKDDLAEVATDLIREFGSDGTLVKNDHTIDPISGIETGTPTTVSVKYFIEPFGAKDLIEGRIIAGDSKLYLDSSVKPESNWHFVDDVGIKWNIVNDEIEVPWVQGGDIAYFLHIRR